jgi:hypothetical protein
MMLIFLEELMTCDKGMTACQVASEACPEKLKASLEGMEAAMFTLKGSLYKMEVADLEATLKGTEAAAEQQALCNKV